MLPTHRRIHRSAEFRTTVRAGIRASSEHLFLYALPVSEPDSRAGLIVSKAVGGAVVRHRVSRQLRHLLASRLPSRPGRLIVLRARPSAAGASSQSLATSLDAAWRAAERRLAQRQQVGHDPGSPAGVPL
ncbi:MAG: ribonuclease P protein component [Candidatus Nanopelagicales bacterium]